MSSLLPVWKCPSRDYLLWYVWRGRSPVWGENKTNHQKIFNFFLAMELFSKLVLDTGHLFWTILLKARILPSLSFLSQSVFEAHAHPAKVATLLICLKPPGWSDACWSKIPSRRSMSPSWNDTEARWQFSIFLCVFHKTCCSKQISDHHEICPSLEWRVVQQTIELEYCIIMWCSSVWWVGQQIVTNSSEHAAPTWHRGNCNHDYCHQNQFLILFPVIMFDHLHCLLLKTQH